MMYDADAVNELRVRRGWSVVDLASILGVDDPLALDASYPDDADAWFAAAGFDDQLTLLGAIPSPPRTEPAVSTTVDDQTMTVDEQAAISAYTVDPEMTVDQPIMSEIRRFSNSEIQSYKRCKRKWWLAWYRGLRPRKEPVVGTMMIGNRLHRALEVGYELGGPYHDAMLAALERVIEQDRELVADADVVTKEQFVDESNLERIMLQGYVEWLNETGSDSNLEVVGSEEYVETLVADGVAIIGRLDVVVRRRSDGALSFIDHKTVGAFTQVTKLLPLNEQSRHYQLLQWMTTPEGQRVSGVIFNMLRRVKRTARATPPFYLREEHTHNRVTMENYFDRLMSEIDKIRSTEAALVSGVNHQVAVYPSPSPNCAWDCPFLGVCSMFDDGSRVEDAIAAQFEVGDPLSYYDKDKENGENA